MKEIEIYKEAYKKFGDTQLDVAIEEMSELTKELCKYKRNYANRMALVEEIADVKIMIEQLIYIFDCSNEVETVKRMKLDRVEKMLGMKESED